MLYFANILLENIKRRKSVEPRRPEVQAKNNFQVRKRNATSQSVKSKFVTDLKCTGKDIKRDVVSASDKYKYK